MSSIGPVDAFSIASQGVAKQGQAFGQAVASVETALTAGQQAVAEASAPARAPAKPAVVSDVASVSLPSSLHSVASSDASDLAGPVVSLLTAKDAYLASLKALAVTADVQRTTIDRLGHAVTEA